MREQHFSLRWDELNRLIEGRRESRVGGSVGSGTGAWTYAARMRYRYDGANQRTVKESFEASGINTASRVALFIYPGDFERRGLVRNTTTYDAVTTGVDATETQYMVAGARIVWDPATSATSPNFDRNRRITYALTDLLQTSSGVVDLVSGELLELSTYYPNGARENLWASDSNAPLEPMGFTGKEADEEIGLTYFGERWLMPRLGRWASPDPLHVHASGGGEALNSYHYVSGNLLQARDPNGLEDVPVNSAPRGVRPGQRFVIRDDLPHRRSSFRSEEAFRQFAGDSPVYVYQRDAPTTLAEAEHQHQREVLIRTLRRLHGATVGPDAPGNTGEFRHFGGGQSDGGTGTASSSTETGECSGPICMPTPGGGAQQAQTALDVANGGIGALDPLDPGSPQNGGVAGGGDEAAPRGTGVQIAGAVLAVVGVVLSLLIGRAAAESRRPALPPPPPPPLAAVLDAHPTAGAFSAVIDESGQIVMRPSMQPGFDGLPDGWVARNGGHGTISDQIMGGSREGRRGFTLLLQRDGTMHINWTSRQLNGPTGVVPMEARPGIIRAAEEQTGRRISGEVQSGS